MTSPEQSHIEQRPARIRQPGPPWRIEGRVWLYALAIVVAVAVVYLPAYRAGFIWDDDDYILLNPLLTEPGGLREIWDPTSSRNPQYYPMVFTMFRLERSLWDLNPMGYHVVNVALHAACAVLLLILLRRIGVPGAWFVAGLFALHPVCVESVAWITERKNVLSGFLYFLAALGYLRFDRTSRYRWYGLSVACFVLALLSKTVTASLPIALALVLWWQRRPLSLSRVVTLAAMIGIGFALGMVTRLHEYRHVLVEGGGSVFEQLTFVDRILIAGRAFWFYPFKVVWPADLAFMYTRWEISTGEAWQWLFPVAGLVAAAALALLLSRGKVGRGPVAAAAFYAVTIFPALGFVNVAPLRFSFVADHFQYLASIGALLLIAGAWGWLAGAAGGGLAKSRRFLVMVVVAVGLLGGLAWASQRQARVYHDLGTLWADTARKSPGNAIVQINYGVWLKRHGDLAGAGERYERAIAASPPPSEAAIIGYGNLASVRFCQGRYEEARLAAENCLAIKPDYPLGLYNMGRALWKLGHLSEAEAVLTFLLGLTFDPAMGRAAWDIRRRLDDAHVWFVLAEIQAEQGKVDDALASYRRAIEISPAEGSLHDALLRTLQRRGQLSEAIRAARVASRQVRENAAFRMQLALLLAVAPNPADRNGTEALAIATDLLRQLGEENPHLLSILAAAQAELGRFGEAAATARRALVIAERSGDARIRDRLGSQIASYAKGEPLYHAP